MKSKFPFESISVGGEKRGREEIPGEKWPALTYEKNERHSTEGGKIEEERRATVGGGERDLLSHCDSKEKEGTREGDREESLLI